MIDLLADLDASPATASLAAAVLPLDFLGIAPRARWQMPLFIDVETVPDETRLERFGLGDLAGPRILTSPDRLPDVQKMMAGKVDEIKKQLAGLWPPREWLDAATSQENLQEKPRKGVLDLLDGIRGEQAGEAAAIAASVGERRKLLSVTPEYCRIVSIAMARGDGAVQCSVVGQPVPGCREATVRESDLLRSFWFAAKTASPIVTYNGNHFDLPVIFIRSAILGVNGPAKPIDLTPWKNESLDLMQKRFPKGPAKGLKALVKSLGFDAPVDDCDGGKVGALFAAGELGKIAEYNASDVECTRWLYKFGKGLFWARQ